MNTIYNGDALTELKKLPDGFVDLICTSPPYWGLRQYHHEGQLGQEETYFQYLERLLAIFDEAKRVLKKGGCCFVNLGDSYNGSGHGFGVERSGKQATNKGTNWMKDKPPADFKAQKMPPKCAMMIPERFAIGMIENGWTLRNQIIWHKPNQMPASVTDRFTVDFEKIFFFVKSGKYYFEQQLEPALGYDGRKQLEYNGGNKDVSIGTHVRWKKHKNTQEKGQTANGMHVKREMGLPDDNYFERNVRTVWSVNTEGLSDEHFAVYPQKLVERMVKAGCPENGLVLDMFFGSGTTGIVARKLHRNFLGIELNPEYIKISERRMQKELGMFS